MDDDGADVVWVSFERGNLFGGVVIVYSQLEVVGTADNPILTGDKATRPYWDICKFERLDDCLGLERPDISMAAI